MKVSLNWIQDYLKTDLTNDVIAERLTDLGLECTYETSKVSFTNVVLGKVLECTSHPDSDHLSVCQVDVGTDSIQQIVCGAPNVKENILVPIAKIGATLDNGEFKIKKAKLRGVKSHGMICSGEELQLGIDNDGIMIVESDKPLGTPIENILLSNQDTLYDIDLTPNRGDCLSHLGVARELSIIEDTKITPRNICITESDHDINQLISVNIQNDDGCQRYSTRIINNVKIGPSPQWLVDRLQSIGQKSINNVVDAANYILMDTGHPMHTFDLDRIESKSINIRYAKNDETIVLLDEINHKLKDYHLLICDGKNPIALAGIMGGMKSGVSENTSNILIESAYFTPTVIRKGAKTLDLSTESSKRFERDTDIDNMISAMDQLTQLIVDVAGGDVAKGIIDEYPTIKKLSKIKFSPSKCNKFLGTDLSNNDIEKIFEQLGITFSNKDEIYHCTIPSYRNDLERQVDLFEEIARVYGYNNIPISNVFTGSFSAFIADDHENDKIIRNYLSANGFNEHFSNSLISEKLTSLFTENEPVSISNPLSSEMAFLRNSLFPTLLQVVSFNEKRRQKHFKLFEIGAVHQVNKYTETKSIEEFEIGLVWYGQPNKHWRQITGSDVYSAKGELVALFSNLGCEKLKFKSEDKIGFDESISIYSHKIKLGTLGILSKNMQKTFDIKNAVMLFEGNMSKINKAINSHAISYKAPIIFPEITRDVSILIKSSVTSLEVERLIKQAGGELLTKISLFDLYEGNELGSDEKSFAYSLTFQSPHKTLLDKDIDKIFDKIINSLVKQFQVKLR